MTQGKNITTNKKAYHLYHILETFEAGLSLEGCEVKSLREANVSIKEAFARVENGEVWLINSHIASYEKSAKSDYEPKRKRKLLLHKSEIRKLIGATQRRGLTLIPLRLYFKKGIAKVEIALAKGKKLYDKRRQEAERTAKRQIQRALKTK